MAKSKVKIDWDEAFFKKKMHERMTTGQIARHFKIYRSAVNRALDRRGLKARDHREHFVDWEDVLLNKREHERMTPEEMADKYGYTLSTVKRRIWEHLGSLRSELWERE